MKLDIMERIVSDLLSYYLGLDEISLEKHLNAVNLATKERVKVIDDLEVVIYSNDHNPPHFHVKSRDMKINAKFSIENCELLSGEISSKNLKKINAFYRSPKGQLVMEKIWNKRIQN
ncbi:MAG: DUF4160 domain-containing protein [Bacteroidales bacterium]|nr:DUF4160 domain-containing protein [Bacteroidales bacterium]MDD4770331.1 DUF4160 domain-containing protein [Bacteroidales bacterium]